MRGVWVSRRVEGLARGQVWFLRVVCCMSGVMCGGVWGQVVGGVWFSRGICMCGACV